MQGSNPGLLHFRQTLYRLSYRGGIAKKDLNGKLLPWVTLPMNRKYEKISLEMKSCCKNVPVIDCIDYLCSVIISWKENESIPDRSPLSLEAADSLWLRLLIIIFALPC